MSTVRPEPVARPPRSCHDVGVPDAPAGSRVVALVGNPNVGKSTLFNALTGARHQVGNWPGTTVEVARGRWRLDGAEATVALVDLPGAYSLDPLSPDEELTRDLLVEAGPAGRPDLVVLVADAPNLTRSLYLLAQLRELDVRVVLAVTMVDIAKRRGIDVDVDCLADLAGVPVVALDGRHRRGTDGLTRAVARALAAPVPAPRPRRALPAPVDGDEAMAAAEERFDWVGTLVEAAVHRRLEGRTTWSDRVDRIACAPALGPLLFLAVMWAVFQVTTTVAAPLQDALDGLVSGPVSDAATRLLDAVGLGDTWVRGLVVDGLIAGVGMLLTFVPVMALMFLLLALLESSGYLARAAVVTDRLMRSIGLPGRAFLPLVVGFGCNVPAVAATRVLPDARHRLLVSLLVPFTSCSARLTVYVLVASTFFPDDAGNVVFGMYLLSIVLVIGGGLVLRATVLRAMPDEPLVIDLPPYHRPAPGVVGALTWHRVRGFLATASGIIVATVAAIWLLSAIPVSGGQFAEVPVEDSLYGATAQAVAPAFEPAGFGDWHAVSALLTGFVAKEAVVSSWAQTYAAEAPDDLRAPGALGDELRADFEASSGGAVTPAVLAFLVFLLAYTPCVATLAAQRREIGGRWTALGVGFQLGVAWLLAVAVFQVGRLVT